VGIVAILLVYFRGSLLTPSLNSDTTANGRHFSWILDKKRCGITYQAVFV
jgi:hypothetical protein